MKQRHDIWKDPHLGVVRYVRRIAALGLLLLLFGAGPAALADLRLRIGTAGVALTLGNPPLSASVYTPNIASGVVGALSASVSDGSTPSWTIVGANSGGFRVINGNTLVQAAGGGTPCSTYSDLQAQASAPTAANTPQTFSLTLTPSSPCSGPGGGDPTVGLLTADRSAWNNWKMAGLLSIGGIPNRATQCGATVSPRGGGLDDTAAIRAAVVACPVGQRVQLAAGTFTIVEGNYVLVDKAVTVRGAGAGSTIMTRTGGATMNSPNPGSSPSSMFLLSPVPRFTGDAVTGTTLTADVAAGATSVQVSSTTGLSVGQFVLLDELSGAGWQPDIEGRSTSVWASPDYRVVYHQHNPTCCNDDGSDVRTAYTVNADRMNNEIKQISAVSGNTVSFDSPVMISYRMSHTAELWRFATPFLQQAGVENLTTEYPDDGSITFWYCAYCWASNVENRYYLNPSVAIYGSFRTQVDTFYVHEPAWPVPGGAGYNIDLRWDSSEALIQNGISIKANKVMVARGGGAGSVVGYNYMDDGYINGSGNTWQEMGLNASHLVGPHHVLFEGNWGFNGDSDQTHGNSTNMTFYRNWLTGVRSTFVGLDGTTRRDGGSGCTGGAPMRATGPEAYGWWFSFVGNVLGTPGCTTTANGWRQTGSNQLNPAIFLLGWDDQTNGFVDPNVAAVYPAVGPNCSGSAPNCSSIVDGNYDYRQGQITWASNDTAHVLKNSFYLSSTPPFFSGCPWPWVDPISGTKTSILPAKARYDAGTPFTPVACDAAAAASLTATPSSIAAGASVVLTWNSVGAASCTGTNFVTGGSASGSVAAAPNSTTTYTVTCGAGTPADATVTVAGGTLGTTWDPANVPLVWGLSNGNRTAAVASGFNFFSGLTLKAQSSGLLYAEFQCTGIVSRGDDGFGVGNGSTSLGSPLGSNTNSAKFISDGRFAYNNIYYNSVWSGCVTGDTVGIEADIGTGALAARTYHSGAWGSFSAAPVSAPVATPWYLAGEIVAVGDSITVCSDPSSCGMGPLPGGYSWWQ